MFQTRFSSFKLSPVSDSPLIARLKNPKPEYQSPQAFAHSDFRGLVYADGAEALELLSRVKAHNRTPQRLPSNYTSTIKQDPQAEKSTARSSSTEPRKTKPSATNFRFPQPLNSGLISPLKCSRQESLESTLNANFSAWSNLCKVSRAKISCNEEILKRDREMREIERDAKVCCCCFWEEGEATQLLARTRRN